MTRAAHSEYRVTPVNGEDALVFTDRPGGSGKPPLIYLHQHATSTKYMASTSGYTDLFATLAEDFTVVAAMNGYDGAGQDTWGNALGRGRINELRDMLDTDYGASQKVTLLGASMGAGLALNYAKGYSGNVQAVAVVVPLISMSDLMLYNSGQYATVINNAFSGNYTDANQGPFNSPDIYREDYPEDVVPTAFWTASDDTVTRPIFSNRFVVANPTIPNTNLGALGHTEAAMFAASDGLVEWARRFKP